MRQQFSMLKRIVTAITGAAPLLLFSGGLAGADWYAGQIADALRAAPPSVTHNARIYAWGDDGQDAWLVLVRDGTGPYTCIASGGASPHIVQPSLPLTNPFCADQNAWAFMKALWAEPNPMHPSTSLPDIPGLVWMLGGVSLAKDHVAYGGTASLVDAMTMTPHIIVMPLPIDPRPGRSPDTPDLGQPSAGWEMASKIPMAPILAHIPTMGQRALMAIPLPHSR